MKRVNLITIIQTILLSIVFCLIATSLYNHWRLKYDNAEVIADFKKETYTDKLKREQEMEKKNREREEAAFYTEDPFETIVESEDMQTLGVVDIPRIDEKLPLYDRTSTLSLDKGLALLNGTDYPTGGKNRMTAITGHRGTDKAAFLLHADKLRKGDVVDIDIGTKTLRYQVTKRIIVLPHQTDVIHRFKDRDMIALITCHTPDRTKGLNTHRMIIFAERTPLPPSKYVDVQAPVVNSNGYYLALGGAGGTLIVIIIIVRRRKKKKGDQ